MAGIGSIPMGGIVQLDVKLSTTLRRCSSAAERLKHRRLPFIPFGTTRRWLSAHNREVVGSKPTAGIRLLLCDALNLVSFSLLALSLSWLSLYSFLYKKIYLPSTTTLTPLIHLDASCRLVPSPYLLRRHHVIHHTTR